MYIVYILFYHKNKAKIGKEKNIFYIWSIDTIY